MWELETRLRRCRAFRQGGGITDMAFSPDGSLLVTGSGDHTACVWQLPTLPEDLDEMERRSWFTLGARFNTFNRFAEAMPAEEWRELREAPS